MLRSSCLVQIVALTMFAIAGCSSVLKSVDPTPEDAIKCQAYIKIDENYKKAHRNDYCQNAASSGEISAQYSVGLGYHSDGDMENALKYYRLAAEGGSVGAFLTMGHFLIGSNEKEAVLWYKRYISAMLPNKENGGAGYAALILARHFHEENSLKTEYWLSVCRRTSYRDNCKL